VTQESRDQENIPDNDPCVPGGESRYFGKRLLSDRSPWRRKTPTRFDIDYQSLPHPTGPYPYRLDLADVLTKEDIQKINDQHELVFHLTGDVGGTGDPKPQHLVAAAMEQDFQDDPKKRPRFLYIVGDVVYWWGEAKDYYPQFYEPYMNYLAPIFAIPGNHDGMVANGSSEPSLKAFMDNFCADRPHLTEESGDSGRDAMTQPNCYWTLITPYATLVGIYTNVTLEGKLDVNQIAWLRSELTAADPRKALILTMHHPALSFDANDSGSKYIYELLDDTINRTDRVPDMMVAGHVHNYQRFTRTLSTQQQIPYLVAGGGGMPLLTALKHKLDPSDLPYQCADKISLDNYVDDQYGYLCLTVSADSTGKAQAIHGDYFAVSSSQAPWRRGAKAENSPIPPKDSFTLNLTTHRMENQPTPHLPPHRE
jgi:acid phosphatase type 7